MSALFTGQNLKGRAINAEIGLDSQGRAVARWEMEVVEGEHKGKVARYSGKLNPDNIKYTKRDMKLIGWKGEKSATFVKDVAEANLVVTFNAEIASHNGREWVSARFGGATPLATMDSDAERTVDRLLDEAGDVGGDRSDIPF